MVWIVKRDNQYAYNIIFWRVCVTVLTLEAQQCYRLIVEVRVTQQYKNIACCTTVIYGEFISPTTVKLYLGLQVEYQIFLSDFKQIRSFPTDFHKSLQYQISRKSIRWALH